MNINEPIYTRTSSGWFKLTPQHLGGDAEIAAHLSTTAVTNVPHAFKLYNTPVHIAKQGKQSFISTRIPTLALATHFMVEDGVLVPSFKATTDSVLLNLVWTPPANMTLHLGVSVGTSGSDTVFHEAFLVATLAGESGTFRLPLPNLYKHGPICLGRTEFRADTLSSMMEQVIMQMQTALWNTDLLDSSDNNRRKNLFSYSLADNSQVSTAAASISDLHRVASPVIEKFILI
jgi:hypothetical protein